MNTVMHKPLTPALALQSTGGVYTLKWLSHSRGKASSLPLTDTVIDEHNDFLFLFNKIVYIGIP